MSQIASLPPSGKNKLERWSGLPDAAFHLGSCPISSALTLEGTPSGRAIKVSLVSGYSSILLFYLLQIN